MRRQSIEQNRINQIYDAYMSGEKFQKKWSGNNLGNKLISEERIQAILQLLNSYDITLHDKKILEVGCAAGNIIKHLLRLGAVEENIHGIDIRYDRVNDAKNSFPNVKFLIMDASELDFPENSFDVITTFTLFSSILDPKIRSQIASEIYRVLKPSGTILYYDFRFNNPMNKNVVGINKNEINNLFTGMEKKLKLITLLPPLARRLGKITPVLFPVLSRFPLLRSHYIGLIFKN